MYQQALASPWGTLPATRSRHGAFGEYFRGLALASWFFLLVLQFWWLRDWNDVYELRMSGTDKFIQYAAFTAPLVAHLTLGFSTLVESTLEMLRHPRSRMLVWFCVFMFVLAPLSLNPLRSAGYAQATLGALLVCRWAWIMDADRFRRVMAMTSILMFGFLLVIIVHHGASGTGVGGVQRNRFGQAAFTAMTTLFLTRGSWKWGGVLAAVGCALLVNSRGTLVSIALFVAAYSTFKLGFGRGLLIALCGLMLGVAMLAVPKVGQRLKSGVVDDVMKVNDANRGIGTGLTGRLDTWKEGLRQFARRPAFGWGYRSRSQVMATQEEPAAYLAHSGYVNLLADTGLLGAGLVLGAFAYDFFKRFGLIRQLKRQFGESPQSPAADTLNLHYVVCAFMIAESALWLIEPLYLNLGASLSIMLLLLVMSPYDFGLRWPAPAMMAASARRR